MRCRCRAEKNFAYSKMECPHARRYENVAGEEGQ